MVASAAGRLDVVRELLLAGCDASKWLPVDYRSDSRQLCPLESMVELEPRIPLLYRIVSIAVQVLI